MKSAVIVANGKSSRFGFDKLQAEFLTKTVLQHSVDAFFGLVDEIVIVCDDKKLEKQFPHCKIVDGGGTRGQSVLCGLLAVSKNCQLVAIHDGARPFVSRKLIEHLLEQAKIFGSAIPSQNVTDTVYSKNMPLKRQELKSVQTPQVFEFSKILEAYKSQPDLSEFSDDSQVFWARFKKLNFVEGEVSNKKVTYEGDLPRFSIGNGFDVHQLVDGDGVILGGVKIPFSKKLLGHSDADVLCHAVMDALLSASGQKDIGQQFPDSDDGYKNANSLELLQKVVQWVFERGFEIVSLSAVVVAEQPKLASHIDAIKMSLANAMAVPLSSVNLSATTTEKLGTVGDGLAIAAEAVVLLKGNNIKI